MDRPPVAGGPVANPQVSGEVGGRHRATRAAAVGVGPDRVRRGVRGPDGAAQPLPDLDPGYQA
jgi:hypothetical protein